MISVESLMSVPNLGTFPLWAIPEDDLFCLFSDLFGVFSLDYGLASNPLFKSLNSLRSPSVSDIHCEYDSGFAFLPPQGRRGKLNLLESRDE